ncbi:hypothetical protein D1AOALGA4SA_8938 [Olavius algarvensis Delta 1 endosymbiont]|nr:hypothetical protein D1AOALGA4SA_8938 [Olavius algarvensis Delta 1 endosymbiont]
MLLCATALKVSGVSVRVSGYSALTPSLWKLYLKLHKFRC